MKRARSFVFKVPAYPFMEKEKLPPVFILVLNWNEWEKTVQCVSALERIDYPCATIVIIDNHSENESVGMLRQHVPHHPLLQTERNLGYAGGNNYGIQYALQNGAEFVWIVNPDIIAEEKTLRVFMRAMREDSLIGICGPRIILEAGSRSVCSEGGFIFPERGYEADEIRLEQWPAPEPSGVKETDYVPGSSLFVRSELIRDIGLLREDFFLYGEDAEFSLRAQKHNWKTAVCQLTVNRHLWDYAARGDRSYLGRRSRVLLARMEQRYYATTIVKTVEIGNALNFMKKGCYGKALRGLGERVWAVVAAIVKPLGTIPRFSEHPKIKTFQYAKQEHAVLTNTKQLMEIRRFFKRVLPPPLRVTLQCINRFQQDVVNVILGRVDRLIPPLQLRYKVGPYRSAWKYKKMGENFLRLVVKAGKLTPDQHILDVGCGCGQLAVPLARYLTVQGRYEGFDIDAQLIGWCREHIAAMHPNFHFQLVPIYHDVYNPQGRVKASEYRFPYPDESFDVVVLKSVFTHLLPKDLENYFSESVRVLKKNGHCIISYHLFTDEGMEAGSIAVGEFEFPYIFHESGRVYRSTDKENPGVLIAYRKKDIYDLYERKRVDIIKDIQFYQDILIGVKRWLPGAGVPNAEAEPSSPAGVAGMMQTRASASPALSIITPVLNGANFMRQCLQNVVDQRCDMLEHVVIDGGSEDGTVEILRESTKTYGHLRWFSEKDIGQVEAINKGIMLARGAIIGILGCDDFYEPGALKRVIEIFKGLPEPGLVVANCRLWGNQGQLLGVNRPRKLRMPDLLLGYKINPYPSNPSAYFYHQSLYKKAGSYNPGCYYNHDLDFLLRAIPLATVRYVDEIWGNFRIIEGSKTYEHLQNATWEKDDEEVMKLYLKQLPFWLRWEVYIRRSFHTNPVWAWPRRAWNFFQKNKKNG